MGDSINGEADAVPVNIFLSAFYMDSNLLSYSQLLTIYDYATSHGYGFDSAGTGKAPNHPVGKVNWYHRVKCCNARSQFEERTPVYYTDTAYTQV